MTVPERWIVGDHSLGRSRLDPANVTATGGTFALGLHGLDGAEVRTRASFGPGTFQRRAEPGPV